MRKGAARWRIGRGKASFGPYRWTCNPWHYSPKIAVIRSFNNSEIEALFAGRFGRRLQQLARIAQRKLQQLPAARELRDLSPFPGNRLEALAGDRRGQHSSRVNDQYRI